MKPDCCIWRRKKNAYKVQIQLNQQRYFGDICSWRQCRYLLCYLPQKDYNISSSFCCFFHFISFCSLIIFSCLVISLRKAHLCNFQFSSHTSVHQINQQSRSRSYVVDHANSELILIKKDSVRECDRIDKQYPKYIKFTKHKNLYRTTV